MRALSGRNVTVLLSAVLCWSVALASSNEKQEKTGRLVVIVIDGDIENTPAVRVHIYVRGYLSNGHPSETVTASTVLKQTKEGRYEASLAPGLYDILVSDSMSYPRSKRVEIKPGEDEYWTLKLEIDDEHLEK